MVCIHARSRDAAFIKFLMSLHFVRISDAKFIASRFPATVLNVRNDGFASRFLNEEETSLNTVVYNEAGKQTYQIQSYVIFWHFRLIAAVFNCDIPVFTGYSVLSQFRSSVQPYFPPRSKPYCACSDHAQLWAR